MELNAGQKIETEDEYADTPRGWAQRWTVEFSAAKKYVTDWHEEAKRSIAVFLKEKDTGKMGEKTHLNLYYANINTLDALLYGAPPAAQVKRRFADANDDVARAAGEMVERLLNTDIEREDDGYTTALGLCLQDRLLASWGFARCRYVAEFETQVTPAIPGPPGPFGEPTELAPEVTKEVKTFEDVEIDHVNWDDQLWSPCRRFHDLRWWAHRAYMVRDALIERFGEDIGDKVPLNAKGDDKEDGSAPPSPWNRAEVWEIWDKEHKKVWWFVEGFDQILDSKDDPLQLPGFWPFPQPLAGNLTSKQFVPKTDYEIAREMYEDCNILARRIANLEDSIKVSGAYDQSCGELQSMVEGGGENKMIPVENWAAFSERGGVAGAISWLPLDQIVAAIDKLSQKLSEKMNLLYQVTGMSDIMRGAAQAGATATEQAIKARFAGVRVQSFQQRFAKFAGDLQRIKYQIMCNLFDPETIIKRSNIQATPDAPLAMQAVKFLKEKGNEYRITVDPDSVSLADMTALTQERTEYAKMLGGTLQALQPVAQAVPGGIKLVLEVLKWVSASLKGSSGIEGAFDKALAEAEKAQQQAQQQGPKPDPRMQVEQAKIQGGLAKTKLEIQGDLALEQKKTEGKVIEQKAQAAFMPRPFQQAPTGPLPGQGGVP